MAARCANCGKDLATEGAPCAACAHVAPRLVWHGPAGDAEWILSGRTLVGRARTCTVRLAADREASKEHAAVEPAGRGWRIRDLKSSNGTFVNGSRVRETLALRDGDEIRVGATRLKFKGPGGEATPEPLRTPVRPSEPMLSGGVTMVSSDPALIASAPIDPDLRFRPAAERADTAALRRDYEKLRIVHECHRALGGARDPADVCAKLLDLALTVLPADGGAVLLRGAGGTLEPAASRVPGGEETIQVSETLLARVLGGREAVLSADALADTQLGDAKSIVARGVRSLMAVPLLGGANPDQVRGVLVLENRRRAGAFDRKDLDLLAAVAAQAGIALENAVLADTRDRLARFLPPPLVEDAARGILDVSRRGTLVEATVLFADLRGFTALAERLAPEATVELLNGFFEAMVEEVFSEEGVLDKYLGDGLMALFGVPLRAADAGAGAALRCATRMQARLAAISVEREEGGAPLAMGVGIATGPVVVGAMGCERRLDYTAIGDPVNVAARLCAAAAAGEILCGEAVASRAPAGIALEPVAPLDVKGKARPVPAFRARRA
ncbi:MAG TPA: adenylate/guanylate cyclase domain-containing protein [Anaeromyxobacteraceae bacterium]|nr:adenylate/guanylate cyclase domain-containing protein [Anaeromyxobacteraceae bacterium]